MAVPSPPVPDPGHYSDQEDELEDEEGNEVDIDDSQVLEDLPDDTNVRPNFAVSSPKFVVLNRP